MGLRGPKPKDECAAGDDLTIFANVTYVKRKKGDKTYLERQCVPCKRRHQTASTQKAQEQKRKDRLSMVTVPIFVVPDSKKSQKQVQVGTAEIDLSKLSAAQVEEAKTLHLKGIVATHFNFSNKED